MLHITGDNFNMLTFYNMLGFLFSKLKVRGLRSETKAAFQVMSEVGTLKFLTPKLRKKSLLVILKMHCIPSPMGAAIHVTTGY